MRRLLESLVPHHRHLYWGWVGGMFALYLVLMVSVAGVFVRHESSRTIAQQPVTTVTIDRGEHNVCGLDAAAASCESLNGAAGAHAPIALRATTSR